MIPNGKHKDDLSRILETVRTVYRAMDGVPPIAFMIGNSEVVFTFPILTFAEQAYIASCNAIRKFARGCQAELIVMLTQGRYLEVPPGILVFMTPAERYAFAKEVLFVHWETRARGGRHMLHYPIIRTGEEVILGDPVEVDPELKPDIFFNIF